MILQVLCGGARDDKTRAIFGLFNGGGRGGITGSELAIYLTSAFRVMYKLQPGLEQEVSEAAAITFFVFVFPILRLSCNFILRRCGANDNTRYTYRHLCGRRARWFHETESSPCFVQRCRSFFCQCPVVAFSVAVPVSQYLDNTCLHRSLTR